MKFINNLRIKNKLFLMLVLPIAGLLYFSLNGIWDKSGQSSEMGSLQNLSELAVKVSGLVHEAQKERGSTALFMGSGGKEFVSQLSEQRSETDKKITDLQVFLKGFSGDRFGNEFKNSLDTAVKNLENIKGRRDAAGAMSISASEAIGYYTNTIASFLDVVAHISRLSNNAELTNMTSAYVNLMQTKERAGRERALLSNTFAQDKFGPGIFNKFISNAAEQNTYETLFLSFAATDEKDFYKTKMQGQFADEVARMKKIAFEKGDKGDFGVNDTDWFKMATGKINLLKEVEDRLSMDLNQKAGQLKQRAQTALIAFIVITAVAVILSVLLAYIVIRSITQPLNNMAETSQKIAAGELDVAVNVNSKDEVGILANAFREMIAYLKTMANAAGAIKQGDLTVEVTPKSERDVLGNAFRNMTIYLKGMAHTAEAIAEGDLKGDVTPKSEKDTLGNAFKKMIVGLRDIVGQLRGGSDQVASASSEIAATAEQSSRNSEGAATAVEEITSTIHEMSANIQNVAKSIQSQSAAVTQTSSSIEELIASIQRVADNARRLAELSGKASEAVNMGKGAVDKSSTGMNEITKVITKSGDTIRLLGSRAEDIGKIVEVIDDIAEQTNLLALNAAIEAARAGEHGMGFAVVADEVRKLAERSAKSTKEIGDLIYGIQKDTQAAVNNVEKNVGVVEQALKLSAEVVESLKKIEGSVTDVSSQDTHQKSAQLQASRQTDATR
ncbi:MAG: nitrate- and nitrite sensing domain-containing protein [Deltaproteobacteria bacterium]|nr:nitrate- and nitrite sensing domain-containing protein [Deltaproteobacteria bacterium]